MCVCGGGGGGERMCIPSAGGGGANAAQAMDRHTEAADGCLRRVSLEGALVMEQPDGAQNPAADGVRLRRGEEREGEVHV